MVCNLTIGKKKFVEVEGEARDILAQFEQLQADLRRAVSEDAESFERVMAAKPPYRGYSNGTAGGMRFEYLGSPSDEFPVPARS